MNILALTGEVQTYKMLGERLLTSFPEADDETIRDTWKESPTSMR